ncbi:helix-turn-helix domain-containing protein [Bifidobacterium miconis]|uniref:helix-turn-helix domain-containing protein n=1 Tax=Bifidobacterium miconis TaxID=2834435 RepID=UPI001F2DEF72|nr:helix-turn-helix domain-containing protein [Bifidobacterium miconis]
MATGKKKPTVESKALSIAIRRAMATREMKTPGLAEASAIPYGTMRKILELNTVADYEQLRRIAIALNIPLSEIVADAERLSTDPGIQEDYARTSSPTDSSPVSDDDADGERSPDSDEAVTKRALGRLMDLAAKHGDTEAEQEAYEELP